MNQRSARVRLTTLAVAAALACGATLLATAPAQADTATFVKASEWSGGYTGQITVKNTGTTTLNGWTVVFDLPSGTTVGSYWDALMTQSGSRYTFKNRDYNGTLAPGASATFGWVGTGTGAPTGCTLNGKPCTGGPDPSPSPTVTPTTSPSPTVSPTASPSPTVTPTVQPGGTLWMAPYVDMGAWPTPILSDMVTASGVKNYTLAFVGAGTCKATWFGAYDPRSGWAKDQIDAVRAAGGDVKISFGGASGVELAQACTDVTALYNEYKAVVDTYGLKYIDLDIEGTAAADTASINRRSQALARLQQTYPNLKISLTLPVLPEGLVETGINVVKAARDAGVNLDLVNVMAMDYYRDVDYGDAAVQAANGTFAQLKTLYPAKSDAQLWKMLAVTPMLGKNDDGRTFDQNDARQLVAFAKSKHLGMLSFWEATRDRNACNGPLYKCTNIAQTPYEFAKIFVGYTG